MTLTANLGLVPKWNPILSSSEQIQRPDVRIVLPFFSSYTQLRFAKKKLVQLFCLTLDFIVKGSNLHNFLALFYFQKRSKTQMEIVVDHQQTPKMDMARMNQLFHQVDCTDFLRPLAEPNSKPASAVMALH